MAYSRSRSAACWSLPRIFVVAKRLAWTPGGFALSFGRMLQDGIVKKYLDDHCPESEADALRLQGPASRRRRRLVLGQSVVRQTWTLRRARPGNGGHCRRQPHRLPRLATQNRGGRNRPATGCRAYRRRRAQFDLAHLRNDPALHAAACGPDARPRASSTARYLSPRSTRWIIRWHCCRWHCFR